MYKCITVIVVLLCITSAALAQSDNWQSNEDGTIEYNCELITTIVAAVVAGDRDTLTENADAIAARFEGESELTLTEYIGTTALVIWLDNADAEISSSDVFNPSQTTCDDTQTTTTSRETADTLFSVTVNGDINVRSCAGTDCETIGTATNGSLLRVIGQTDDWYEIEFEDSTGFVASWLTTRGPDAIISTSDPYMDTRTGCYVVFDPKRGDMNIALILAGELQDDVLVDLYRPSETRPLQVANQYDKTFIDTGESYIHQVYSWNVGWPQGMYQLEISLDGAVSRLGWELENRADYNIFVMCE